jgi:hypothetical protein
MSDSLTPIASIQQDVLEATLISLGGELLDGSGFENEAPIDLDYEPVEGGEQ